MNRFLLFIAVLPSLSSYSQSGYRLEIELVSEDIGVLVGPLGLVDLTGYSCTRLYVTMNNATDFMNSVSGDATNPTFVNTTTNFYHAELGGATPGGINPVLYGFYPELAYDSWVTIGLEQQFNAGAGEAAVEVVQSSGNPWSTNFEPGFGAAGGNIAIDDVIGGAWYALNGDANGVAGDDLRVLVGQFTTTGVLSGQLYCQVFIEGDGSNEFRDTLYIGINGCSQPEACNFESNFGWIDDGSCIVPVEGQVCCSAGPFISEFSEGVADNTYLEIYNAGVDSVVLSKFQIGRTANQLNDVPQFDYFDIQFPLEDKLGPGETYLIVEDQASSSLLAQADLVVDEISSGDDAVGLLTMEGQVLDIIGELGEDEGLGWTVDGVSDATFNGTIRRQPEVGMGNMGVWDSGPDQWLVVEGQDIAQAGVHDCITDCVMAVDNLIRGCTDSTSCAFDADAHLHVEFMCEQAVEWCVGCTDLSACNFLPTAIESDSSCVYPVDEFGVDFVSCDGFCLNDADSDGVCDELEVFGCTFSDACNFMEEATENDGSCSYACVTGCTDPDGCNYDAANFIDDGSCDYSCVSGCTDPDACNFSASFIYDDGSCFYTCLGCTDPDACNYSLAAADDDGSCEYLSCVGCGDTAACNYDVGALISDNAQCVYPELYYTCSDTCEVDVDGDGICDPVDDCIGIPDSCGVCNGPGAIFQCGCNDIPDGSCDCDGSVLDAIDVCGGDCEADADGDLICDDVDPCVGEYDECGVCNGLGQAYDCGCFGIPVGQCDCEGKVLDAAGVCGGDCVLDSDGDGVCDVDEVAGCTDVAACNFSEGATDDDGTCLSNDAIGVCGGSCEFDLDQDGVCDDVDTCVGMMDECGVCNGPGAVLECGCTGVAENTCDCEGAVIDALGVCGGPCLEDENGNGVCDALESGLCGPGTYWSESDGGCVYFTDCPTDINGDGQTSLADLLDLLTTFATFCEE
ncbi:lamin tail domain-containing protein [Flavobacteriales bacterium]|nr:lamin tail domain-containing protein [Flavobacteriales bacterium]